MIGQLTGKLVEKHPPFLILDVAGVGYELQASMNTFYHLPEKGEVLKLHTHLVVREDAQDLYGFYEAQEKALFRLLLKANGVGPKMALAILSSMTPAEFSSTVFNHDVARMTTIPGVGRKTAERLMIEMKDRLKQWGEIEESSRGKAQNSEQSSEHMMMQDAISALVALGYKPQDASRAISAVSGENVSSEVLIRAALQNLGSK